jgi:hypothetical protein
MNGETGAPVCLTVRDVEMFTTPGMVARATDGNPFGAAPVSATGSGGALVAGLTQPDPAVSSTPETTPTTRKIPAKTNDDPATCNQLLFLFSGGTTPHRGAGFQKVHRGRIRNNTQPAGKGNAPAQGWVRPAQPGSPRTRYLGDRKAGSHRPSTADSRGHPRYRAAASTGCRH